MHFRTGLVVLLLSMPGVTQVAMAKGSPLAASGRKAAPPRKPMSAGPVQAKPLHPDTSSGIVLTVTLGEAGWEVVASSSRGESRMAPRRWTPTGAGDDAAWLRGLMSTVDAARTEVTALGLRATSVVLVPPGDSGPAAGRRVMTRRGLDRSLSRAIGLPVTVGSKSATRLPRDGGVLVVTLGAKPSLRQETDGASVNVPWTPGKDARGLTVAEIVKTYKKKGGKKARDLAGVAARARSGDTAAQAAFTMFGRSLGRSLARGRKAPGAGRARVDGALGSALDLYGPAAQEAYQAESGHALVWVAPIELARRDSKR